MPSSAPLSVTVVIPTHNRCEGCKRAVASALEQDPPPLEVLVCDDGSQDATAEEFERLARDDSRVRYLRRPKSAGGPGPARNLGVSAARGEWVAFLDDDDRWLPGKLARQAPFMSNGRYEVVASDARRANGEAYFGSLGRDHVPSAPEMATGNPIITSTAVARRKSVLGARGFETGSWARGVEDYALWLRLADRGARFIVIDEPLIEYADSGESRLSARGLGIHLSLTQLRWRRWLASPSNAALFRRALKESDATIRAAGRALRSR